MWLQPLHRCAFATLNPGLSVLWPTPSLGERKHPHLLPTPDGLVVFTKAVQVQVVGAKYKSWSRMPQHNRVRGNTASEKADARTSDRRVLVLQRPRKQPTHAPGAPLRLAVLHTVQLGTRHNRLKVGKWETAVYASVHVCEGDIPPCRVAPAPWSPGPAPGLGSRRETKIVKSLKHAVPHDLGTSRGTGPTARAVRRVSSS